MFNLMKHQSTRICHLHDRMSGVWDSFRICVPSAEFTCDTGNVSHLKTYTVFLGVFFPLVKEGEASKTTETTAHQTCTASLANFRGAVSWHVGKSINIQRQHECNCISAFCVSGKIKAHELQDKKRMDIGTICEAVNFLLNLFGFCNELFKI